jgi:hypothetical protein
MKPFTTLAILVFILVALAHLYRLVRGLDIVVQGHALPQWISIVGLVLAAVLAVMLWRESRQP